MRRVVFALGDSLPVYIYIYIVLDDGVSNY